MFHRSLHSDIPDFLPVDISLLEIRHFLISTRDGGHYGMDQERRLEMCALRRLGSPVLGKDIGSMAYVTGRSQADIPTKVIFFDDNIDDRYAGPLMLDTEDDIILPSSIADKRPRSMRPVPLTQRFSDLQDTLSNDYKTLTPSAIKLGRFIEDLDRPSEVYFDSELSSYLEGAVWNPGDGGLCFRSFEQDTQSIIYCRYLKAEAIKFRWSICSHRKMVPVFATSSDKKLLTEWILDRKAAFLITAYQTWVNVSVDIFYGESKGTEGLLKNFQDRLLSVSPFGKSSGTRPCKFGESTYSSVLVMNL